MLPRFSALAFFLSILLPLNCWADDIAEISEAKSYLETGNAKAAFDLLSPLESKFAGTPDYDYLLGLSSIDSGNYTRGIFALERVLAVQPDNALVRAELARAYFAVGEIDTAKSEFAQLKASKESVPEQAITTIDRFLSAISQSEADRSTRVKGYVELGYGYDSNVNSATRSGQVALPAIGGAVFRLDPSSQKISDQVLLFGAGADIRVPITPEVSFVGQGSFTQTDNQHEHEFDFGALDVSAGLSFRQERSTYTAALQGNRNWLQGSEYRNVLGIVGQWQYNFSNTSQSTIYAQLSNNRFPDQHVRDATRKVVGAGYAKALGENLPTFFVSIYGGNEDAKDSDASQVGFDLYGIRTGVEQAFSNRLIGFINAAYEHRDYDGEEAFFLKSRNDYQQYYSAGLHYQLNQDWRVSPQISYTDNNSNIPIFEYDKGVASLVVRRMF